MIHGAAGTLQAREVGVKRRRGIQSAPAPRIGVSDTRYVSDPLGSTTISSFAKANEADVLSGLACFTR